MRRTPIRALVIAALTLASCVSGLVLHPGGGGSPSLLDALTIAISLIGIFSFLAFL